MRFPTSSLARFTILALAAILVLSLVVGLGINYYFVDLYRTNLIDQRISADQVLLRSMRDDFQRYRSVAQLLSIENEIRAINQAGDWYNPTFDYLEFLDDLRLVERVANAPIAVTLYLFGRRRSLSASSSLEDFSHNGSYLEDAELTNDRIDKWQFFSTGGETATLNVRYLTVDMGRITPRSLAVELVVDLGRYRAGYARLWSVREGYLFLADSFGSVDAIPEAVPDGLLAAALENHDPMSIAGTAGAVAVDGREWRFAVEGDPATGVMVGTLVPSDLILQPLTRARLLVIAVFAVSLSIAGAVAFMVIRRLVMPLNRFVGSLKEFGGGDLSHQAEEGNAGELETMYRTFNDMVNRINSLIDTNYGQELRTRRLQLKFLQSQINPHFLHNCMNFIYQMSFNQTQPAIASMALHLSKYYRYMMDWSSDDSTLSEELEHARVFLEIHKLRLGDRLSYSVDVGPSEISATPVPRLILQPLVENAVLHGVEETEEDAWIGIIVVAKQNRVLVEVRNGPTEIDPAGLERIRRRLFPEGSDSAVERPLHALSNVGGRLSIRYGGEAEFSARLDGSEIVFRVSFPQSDEKGTTRAEM